MSNTISSYVRSAQNINPPITENHSNIYIIQDGILVTPPSISIAEQPNFDLLELSIDGNGFITSTELLNSDGSRATMSLTNLDMLCYDARYDTACLNKSKINKSMVVTWGCHEFKNNDKTYMCNKALDQDTFITMLRTGPR